MVVSLNAPDIKTIDVIVGGLSMVFLDERTEMELEPISTFDFVRLPKILHEPKRGIKSAVKGGTCMMVQNKMKSSLDLLKVGNTN